MPTRAEEGVNWPELRRARRAIVVVDMVESVLLIDRFGDAVIQRWRAYVAETRSAVLPAHGGRMVKSLGDGMLLEFVSAPQAVGAVLQMQRLARERNQGVPAEQAIHLRMGAHVCDIVVDELDVYGAGVNLAARLASAAEPGQICVSAEVCDGLAPGLDADVVDLGDLYYKHIEAPVRTFRLSEPELSDMIIPRQDSQVLELLPVVAVIPLSQRVLNAEAAALGDVLADELIVGLSQSNGLRVISRLSTAALRDRSLPLNLTAGALRARFVVTGSYHLQGDALRLSLQLADARSDAVLWAREANASLRQVLGGADAAVLDAVAAICAAIAQHELRRATSAPLPSLDSCSLLMGAVALMHRPSSSGFERAFQMLEVLVQRHPRQPLPHAWTGKWHVLKVVQGWSHDKTRQTQQALAHVRRALDTDPHCSLALTIEGLILAYLKKDMAGAGELYAQAVEVNPSESLAWLFTSTLHSYRDEGALAAVAAERALSLSPLDPMAYFFDSLAATAVLSSGDHVRAAQLAQRSLKRNRSHTSTYRTLAIAQVLGNDVVAARETVTQLLLLEPGLTVGSFVDRYPGTVAAQVDRYAQALRLAGVPS